MDEIDFTSFPTFFLTSLFIFLGIFGRYVTTALVFELLVKKLFRQHFAAREVQLRPRRARQDWIEIGWSLITSLLFALAGTLMLVAWQKGYTQVYLDWDEYSAIWFFLSIGVMLFLHETYYYWLHRWMHKPGVYKMIHKVHHASITTSAWTSFSFHPLESLLQAAFIPLMVLVIPLHIYALGAILALMTLTSVINHLNTEVYPRDFNRHWFGRWWIGATHHSLHHAQFRFNYGLYFTFWDRWMRTESPDYTALFDKKTQPSETKLTEKMRIKIH
jgi:Delta7-sterol 5-desaturase